MLTRAGTTATVEAAAKRGPIDTSTNNIINSRTLESRDANSMQGARQSQGESSRKDNRNVGDACNSAAYDTTAMPATEGTSETAMMPW